MAVDFPSVPEAEAATPTYRDFSAVSTPPSGGQEQRVARLGDRWTVTFAMPSMGEDCLLKFVAVQTRARTLGETVRMAMPRKGAAPEAVVATGNINAAVVNANAAGSTTVIAIGMFFSFITAGHAYLHQVTSIDGGVLGIAPRLRAPLNGALNFAAPIVEGWLTGDTAWSVERLADTGLAFTIAEDR